MPAEQGLDSPDDLSELDAYDADLLDALVYQALLYGLCSKYVPDQTWILLTKSRGLDDFLWDADELERHLLQITSEFFRFALHE